MLIIDVYVNNNGGVEKINITENDICDGVYSKLYYYVHIFVCILLKHRKWHIIARFLSTQYN